MSSERKGRNMDDNMPLKRNMFRSCNVSIHYSYYGNTARASTSVGISENNQQLKIKSAVLCYRLEVGL